MKQREIMKRYQVGLQLINDQPMYGMYITAKTSNDAWDQAQQKYKNRGFNKSELNTMVLYNEKKLS